MSFLTVAAIALTAVGTGLSIAGQEKAKNEQESALEAEQIRQRGFQKQAENEFNDSLGKSGIEPAKQDIQAGTDRRVNAYQEAAATGPKVTAPVNKVVADAGPYRNAAALSKATQNAWGKVVGGSQAKLGAGGDWAQNQSIKNLRASQNLATIGNKAAGSAGVSRIELQQASHAGDNYAQVGQILSAAGMLVGAYGATTAPTSNLVVNTPKQSVSTLGNTDLGSANAWANAV